MSGPPRHSPEPAIPALARLSLALLACAPVGAAGAEDPVDFSRDVLPILSDTCFQCHGPDAQEGRKGDLRLDDEADVKRVRDPGDGGDPVRAVTPGDPEASLLWKRLIHPDPEERMPPPELGRSLDPPQIRTIQRWIAEGAPWGKHWAFESVRRPAVSALDHVSQGTFHPVDSLVNARLVEKGLEANPRASRRTLIRRLFLDLTGLPPSPADVEDFVRNRRENAWEHLVDRLLNSPSFGERLAWDWLEAARYADSNGYQGDRERTMWPWRNWVVDAFNANLSFDQFTLWQLAGDLLPEPTPDQILATGFNRNHMINGEGGRIPEENRVDYVMDMAETAGTVWLGLTFNCCRCHDHKFDPLTQREYYQFTAFFNQTPVDGGGGDAQTPPVLEVPSLDDQRALGDAEKRFEAALDSLPELPDLPPACEEEKLLEAARVASEKNARERGKSDWDALIAYLEPRDAASAGAFRAVRDALDERDRRRSAVPRVMVMRDLPEKRPTHMLERGLYNQPGAEVEAGVPGILHPLAPAGGDGAEADRLDLARWLVTRENPLTARVAVNRFWQMLFGIGLVKTAEDFGVQGEFPPQRDLLDWLAAEFMESGWDVKRLFRMIVTSETYQRSSSRVTAAGRDSAERDPENRFLARGPRYRLPSWMIRDQALAAAGLLDRRVGGPPVYPYQPDGVWAEATFGNKQYQPDQGAGLYRRSLSTFWRRIVGPTLFFDTAKRQVCEVKPLRTNTPMHALTTLNDVTYVEAARALADRLLEGGLGQTARRMDEAGLLLLGRTPSSEERAIWLKSLQRARQAFSADPDAARLFLSHGEHRPSPAHEPVTLAAWTALCLNLLNLDETLTKE